ncbi:DUF2391 family protein [Arenicella sp. 4NH20-0111]|uniref:DUF2391 family protein n=1 Tax=Arenicella sp. 4NH20-0111 TaxID=3127648 RepID=UPI003108FF8A
MADISFNSEDASQVMIGAFTLAVPISFSEEAWRLGETLALPNLIALICVSVVFLSLYTYQSVFQGNIENRVFSYVIRIIIAYGLASLVVAITLMCLNKFPLFTDPTVAIKRLFVVAMPASMGAIVVDSFDKE